MIPVKLKSCLLFMIISVSLCSCLSLPTLQSGRTVGQRNIEIAKNVTYGNDIPETLLSEDTNFDNRLQLGFRMQAGISDKLDLGLSMNSAGFVGLNVKYQYAGTQISRFASSVGLESGFNSGTIFLGKFNYYVTVPVFTSFHPTENITLFLTPRYIYISENNYDETIIRRSFMGPDGFISRVGSSYGIMIGDKHKVGIEISHYGTVFYVPTHFVIGYTYMITK